MQSSFLQRVNRTSLVTLSTISEVLGLVWIYIIFIWTCVYMFVLLL